MCRKFLFRVPSSRNYRKEKYIFILLDKYHNMIVAAKGHINRNLTGRIRGTNMFVLIGNSSRTLDRAVVSDKKLLRG